MLNQAKEFNESVQLSGIILTKLDGTARGGAVVSWHPSRPGACLPDCLPAARCLWYALLVPAGSWVA